MGVSHGIPGVVEGMPRSRRKRPRCCQLNTGRVNLECEKLILTENWTQVMTGFRISYGGAQQHFGVTPDVTTMGKVNSCTLHPQPSTLTPDVTTMRMLTPCTLHPQP